VRWRWWGRRQWEEGGLGLKLLPDSRGLSFGCSRPTCFFPSFKNPAQMWCEKFSNAASELILL
jgi:hypothetical protein